MPYLSRVRFSVLRFLTRLPFRVARPLHRLLAFPPRGILSQSSPLVPRLFGVLDKFFRMFRHPRFFVRRIPFPIPRPFPLFPIVAPDPFALLRLLATDPLGLPFARRLTPIAVRRRLAGLLAPLAALPAPPRCARRAARTVPDYPPDGVDHVHHRGPARSARRQHVVTPCAVHDQNGRMSRSSASRRSLIACSCSSSSKYFCTA